MAEPCERQRQLLEKAANKPDKVEEELFSILGLSKEEPLKVNSFK